jgi:hypothetical protein
MGSHGSLPNFLAFIVSSDMLPIRPIGATGGALDGHQPSNVVEQSALPPANQFLQRLLIARLAPSQ